MPQKLIDTLERTFEYKIGHAEIFRALQENTKLKRIFKFSNRSYIAKIYLNLAVKEHRLSESDKRALFK